MAFENLVIHWRDQALKWLLLDDAQLPLREGQGTLEDLAEVLSEYELPLHTSVLLSGESVLLKTIEVPPKPTRQILDAVPYLVAHTLIFSTFLSDFALKSVIQSTLGFNAPLTTSPIFVRLFFM